MLGGSLRGSRPDTQWVLSKRTDTVSLSINGQVWPESFLPRPLLLLKPGSGSLMAAARLPRFCNRSRNQFANRVGVIVRCHIYEHMRAYAKMITCALSHTPAYALSHTPAYALSHTPAYALSHTPAYALSHTPTYGCMRHIERRLKKISLPKCAPTIFITDPHLRHPKACEFLSQYCSYRPMLFSFKASSLVMQPISSCLRLQLMFSRYPRLKIWRQSNLKSLLLPVYLAYNASFVRKRIIWMQDNTPLCN